MLSHDPVSDRPFIQTRERGRRDVLADQRLRGVSGDGVLHRVEQESDVEAIRIGIWGSPLAWAVSGVTSSGQSARSVGSCDGARMKAAEPLVLVTSTQWFS